MRSNVSEPLPGDKQTNQRAELTVRECSFESVRASSIPWIDCVRRG